MRPDVSVTVLLAVLCQMSRAVTVTEGEYQFSLESVKILGGLLNGEDGAWEKQDVTLVRSWVLAVCSNPSLPQEFQPLCQGRDTVKALTRLRRVAARSNACEICESVACTGC